MRGVSFNRGAGELLAYVVASLHASLAPRKHENI
jgi:hypothetical protein